MKYSEVESKRFGFQVFRDKITKISPSEILEDLISNKADIAIIRIPTSHQNELYKLSDLGIPFIVADTFVEYSIKLHNYQEPTLINKNLELIECRPEDVENLEWVDFIIDKAFNGYSNHYFSNPYLNPHGNLEGYKEWIRNCLGDKGKTWLVKLGANPVAFFSGTFNQKIFEGGPGAVLPEFEGQGIYLDAVKLIPYLLKKEGFTLGRTSTQIQNLVVQRQWLMLGYNQTKSLITLHLTPFFNKALTGIKVIVKSPNDSFFMSHQWIINEVIEYIGGLGLKISKVSHIQLQDIKPGIFYNFFYSPSIINHNSQLSLFSICVTDESDSLVFFLQLSVNENKNV